MRSGLSLLRLAAGCVCAVLLFLGDRSVAAEHCVAELYRNGEFTVAQDSFSPYDKIYVLLRCSGLPDGSHVMHANWIHEKQGLVRADKLAFEQTGGEHHRTLFFWFKLHKRGPFTSALTNTDFHSDSYGQWQVEVSLDERPLLAKAFSIVQQ